MRMKYLPVVAALFAGVAGAQTAPPAGSFEPVTAPPSSSMQNLDTDGDGTISRTEAQANLELSSQFSTLDANANGALESAEFARFEVIGTHGATPATPASPGAPGTPGATPATPASPSSGTPPPSAPTDRGGGDPR